MSITYQDYPEICCTRVEKYPYPTVTGHLIYTMNATCYGHRLMDTFDPDNIDPFVRNTDAFTSVIAAVRASHASTKAVAAVARLMNDGRDRIDYEIWQECRANGYISSFATVRHGRLVFSDTKLLVETGETRPTPDGLPSRVWCLAPGVVLPEDQLRIRVPNRMSPPTPKAKRPTKPIIDSAVEDLRQLAESGIDLSENVQAVIRWLSALAK